jgi:hypothetical protein
MALCPPLKLEDNALPVVCDAYSLYSQLSSISGGRLLRLKPEDVRCCGDEGSTKELLACTALFM